MSAACLAVCLLVEGGDDEEGEDDLVERLNKGLTAVWSPTIALPVAPMRSKQHARLLYATAVSGCSSPSAGDCSRRFMHITMER
eukprot:1185899-Prorocentrum_minimum.AAC.1